jgi:fluoride exporter
LQKYFFIALGGSLGSIARYWVGSTIASRMGTKFPYGTFVINVTACLIIGFSLTLLGSRTELNLAWRFLVPVGFVGAYSTFSTFEWEIFTNLQTGAFLIGSSYVVLSLFLGLVGVWCGVLIARAFL